MGNEGFNLREERLEPFKQSATAGIADTEPNDDRTGLALAHAVGKILVFGDDDGLVREGMIPDGRIIGMPQTDIGNVLGGVAMADQKQRESRRQLGVDQKAHGGSAGEEHRVVGLGGGVVEAGLDIGGLQIGEVLKDFGLRDASGEEIEHVLHANAHAADAGAAAALMRIEGDAVDHGRDDSRWDGRGKGDFHGG